MPCVIKLEWPAGEVVIGEVEAGSYVAEYDPDAHDGFGYVRGTSNIAEAKPFASAAEALGFYRQTSTVRPLRGDGRPNRPLTAFTVSIENIA